MKIIHQTSAGGIVFKKEDNQHLWLIVQHSQHKGWVFPKGLVGDKDSSETMEEAALREVKEEGGVTAKIIDLPPIKTFYQYRWQDELIKKTVYYYLMEYQTGDPANHDWEVSQANFFSQEEVLSILTYPSDKNAFQKILKLIKDKKINLQ